ncbi:MAG: hypothetical protein AAGD32_14955 [Planctomycetota bacterium]
MTTANPPAAASAKKSAGSSALPMIGGQYHFLFRRLHSLTGILFGGYIVVHLLVNATLLEGTRGAAGATVFQQQVDKIHSLPWLIAIEWTAILMPLIYHTIYGIYITVTGVPNVGNYGFTKNWFYLAQRVSAIILVFFIAFHVISMKMGGTIFTFVPHTYATESTAMHLQAFWWVWAIVYPIGILAGTFHLSNGFWTAAITWGLTTTKTAQKRWGLACIGLFGFTTACGFAALIGGVRAPIDEETAAIVMQVQENPHGHHDESSSTEHGTAHEADVESAVDDVLAEQLPDSVTE